MNHWRVPAAGLLVIGSIGLLGRADARPNYPRQVPTPYSCETCHLDPNDRLNRNGFGIDFALERGLWVNPAQAGRGMCYLDSDFDGLTNGEELDDPACVWRPGTPLPAGPTTHPGDGRDPDQCGDGVIIPLAEDCDGALPEGESCQTRGFDEGELGCNRDCTFDESDCRDLPPPDMAPPDPDMAPPAPDMAPVDPMEDAGVTDAMDDTPDAAEQAPDATEDTPDAMDGADAMSDDHDAMSGDAGVMRDASAIPQDDMSPAAADPTTTTDCHAAPGRSPGAWALVLLAVFGIGRRRLG